MGLRSSFVRIYPDPIVRLIPKICPLTDKGLNILTQNNTLYKKDDMTGPMIIGYIVTCLLTLFLEMKDRAYSLLKLLKLE